MTLEERIARLERIVSTLASALLFRGTLDEMQELHRRLENDLKTLPIADDK